MEINSIGNVKDYPTMHYFGIRRQTQSMTAEESQSIYGKSCFNLHCGNVVHIPLLLIIY